MRVWFTAIILCGCLRGAIARAESPELCIYVARDGGVHQVNSASQVPTEYRAGARCFSAAIGGDKRADRRPERRVGPTESRPLRDNETLVSPGEFELDGASRRVDMASPLGRFELRWSRSVETRFGRTPERALAEAARAVSRALRSGPFPSEVRTLDATWSVVFMDTVRADGQIPASLVGNCHPGWMTPPANIYIVADRVASGCSSGAPAGVSIADETLATILIHEIGHAVEFVLLAGRFGHDRARAEGFATWFTGYVAPYAPLLASRGIAESYRATARAAGGGVGWAFRGTANDYARAAMIFEAIAARRGVRGIVAVYGVMVGESLELIPAIERAIGWNEAKLTAEVARVINADDRSNR